MAAIVLMVEFSWPIGLPRRPSCLLIGFCGVRFAGTKQVPVGVLSLLRRPIPTVRRSLAAAGTSAMRF